MIKVTINLVGILFEKKKGNTFNKLKFQILDSLSAKMNFNKIIIAYEPIWSIGTGIVPKVNDLKKTFIFIKKSIKEKF